MTTPYKPHEQRVIDEAKELNTKLSALRTFQLEDFFDTLAAEDQALLMMQEMAMQNYLSILHRRVERFDK
jgi:hypothetical protein